MSTNDSNCSASDAPAIVNLVHNSLLIDTYPQLSKEEKARPNVGNIVRLYMH